MKTDTKRLIALWIFAIICGFLNSCGAKKTTKNESELRTKIEVIDSSKSNFNEQSAEELETNIKKEEKISVDNQDKTITIEETIEPIDSKLPASYIDKDGKKQSLNNAKKTTKSTTKNNNTKSNSEIKGSSLIKGKSNDKKFSSDHKSTKSTADIKQANQNIFIDRKAWSMWNFIWFLLVIPIYWLWKNKAKIIDKIWWL